MSILGIYIAAFGAAVAVLVSGGSFISAVLNMASKDRSFDERYKKHLQSMAGMAGGAIGGCLIMLVGALVFIAQQLQ